jgi:hypothetical protein
VGNNFPPSLLLIYYPLILFTVDEKVDLCYSLNIAMLHSFFFPFPASVTHIEWFDEEKEFAIAFTDGVVKLGRKNPNFQPTSVSAHQVSWEFVSVGCFLWNYVAFEAVYRAQ